MEHWAKIGEIMEDNPDLSCEFVRQVSKCLELAFPFLCHCKVDYMDIC
ncbi:hypothetical protein J9B83_14385 [Marinomonas sp. A79]|uniref:Uncharacterized protein n=1 Tax=Marinomonas vulgaris TaxID=2823372 RepID=A0ABS5HEL3_9GAMM|nr:hypothetical protein [Marinomonas vulgaris]